MSPGCFPSLPDVGTDTPSTSVEDTYTNPPWSPDRRYNLMELMHWMEVDTEAEGSFERDA